jgi:adenosylcobinamide-phosphate synthase
VRFLGWLASFWEKKLYAPSLAAGAWFWLAFMFCLGLLLAALLSLLGWLPWWAAGALAVILAYTTLATRALHRETALAEKALLADDLPAARRWLSWVVSRQTEGLDPPQVRRALLETIAENLSDGVVAPIFWGLLAGLPGMFLYKGINTLDSMVGYRNQRYNLFGRVAARIDDAVNFLPARLTALLIVLLAAPLGSSVTGAARGITRDHAKASSPNAGWPEAALAGALDVRLGGPSRYFDHVVEKPLINADGHAPMAGDFPRAVRLLYGVALAAVGLAAWGLHTAGAGYAGLAGLLFS